MYVRTVLAWEGIQDASECLYFVHVMLYIRLCDKSVHGTRLLIRILYTYGQAFDSQ